MNKFRIFAVGSGLLFLLELGYSIALQRYELAASSHPFFRGPVTATITDLLAEGRHGALAAREVKGDAKTTDFTRSAVPAPGRRVAREARRAVSVPDAAAVHD